MVAESFKRSHKILALCVALAFASAALALGFAVTANAEESGSTSQPTISSDKADYPPGGTVILTGSGWQPGESVNIFVNDDEGKTWSRDVDVTADENGDIRDEFQLPSWFVAKYSVKATGTQSGVATTSFTDAAAQLQGQSNPPCTSGGQCDSGWQSTNLSGWQELDEIPLRLKFPATGTFTINIDFDHFQTSSGSPGIQNLYNWTPGSGVTLQGDPTLTTGLSGGKWRYTLTANVTNANAILNFKGNLAAGAHNFTGSSLALGGSDVGGTVQVAKPAARPGNPDLVVDKTGPTTAARDDVVTYTLNYQNKSAATSSATGIQLTDVLPSGVTYVANSCSGTCTVAGGEVVWNLGTLAPGESGSRTLQVRIPSSATFGASYTDLARIRSAENDLNPADNDDSLTTTVQFNRNPVANNDSYNVNEDQTLTVSDGPSDVLANDTDADNDPLTVTGNTEPSHGSVTVNANGSFTYTPTANYNGPDSFNYTVSDGKGGTATGTVNITVNSVNDTPTITPNIGDKTILEDADTGDISFTVGDADSLAGDLVVAASSSDTTLVPNDNANLILGGSGANRTIKVKPAADRFGGPATITLTVSDGSQSATETFDVNVTPVNDAPSFDVPANAPPVNEDASAQTVSNFATNLFVGPFETSQTITEFQVTNNSNPSLFSAGPAIDPDSGDLTYTPAPNAFGTANVTVRAKDDGGTANGGVDTSTGKTFSITIDSVNDDPNAVDDSANAEEDGPAVAIDVLANDDDGPDSGETLSVTSVTQPPAGEGSTEIIASGPDAGKVRFTPSADFFGQTSFEYTISDGNGGTDTATVTVDVSSTNDPPEIGFTDPTGDTQTVDESVTQTRTYSYTLDNTDGPAAQVTESCGGATKVDTPEANSFKCVFPDGPNTFTVSVTADDDQAQNNTASDSIEVTVNNVAPTANDDSASADEEGPAVEVDVLANDTDPANGPSETNDPLTITNVSGPPSGEGSVEIIESGKKVRFTPNPNFEGLSTSFSYTISDGDGGTDTASVTINLNPVNDAPVNSVPGTQNINEDQSRVFSAANSNQISISDSDAGNDDVEVTLTADHGKLTLGGLAGLLFSSGDGTDDATMTFTGSIPAINAALNLLTFAPDANYDGSDAKLTIVTNDQGNNGSGGEKTDTDSVAFDIAADNDPPVIDSVVVTNANPVEEGSSANIKVTATDPDTPSSELRYSFDCDNSGTFEKGPQAADTVECTYFDNGTYPVQVKVTDDADNSDTDSVNVTVVNVAPAATFDAAPNTIDEGQNINLSLKDVVDPGTLDTHEYRFDCGDGTFGAWTELPASGEATISCPADDDGNVTVRGQVRDDDGGESPVYEETITVSNTAPRVTLLSGPDLVKESTTIERTYTFNATDAGDDALTIDVGCGANGELVDANGADPGGTYSYDPVTGDGSFKCVFPDGGPDGSTQSNVTVKATDDNGLSDSDNQVVLVTVENDNPQATFNAPGSVNEGDNINLSLTDATDPAGSNDTLEYAFKCGDADWSGFSSSNTASCPTSDNGQVIVKGQVKDEDGGKSDVYEKTVTVNNVAPKVVLSGPDKADEGDTKQYSFTVTDPGTADTFTVENGYPTCGQNGQIVGGSFSYDPATKTGSFECRFPDGDSTTNVEIQVRDDDGAIDADSQRVVIVEVANVAPALAVAADQNSNEGQNKSFDLGSFTDPGDDGSWNVTVDWGDGTANTTFDSASAGNLPQKPHTYADDGSYTVTVKVAEAGGAPSDTKTFTVTVANVRPTVSLTGPNTADEGQTKTYNFTVTDPGTADTHTIDRSCGDNGTEVQDSFSYDQNTKTGSFECRFPDGPAETNVTVKATDDRESDQDNQRVVVTVANVAPTVELTGADTANEGDTKKYDFTITDPGDDEQTVDWDCGDNGEKVGGSFSYDPATKTGSFECRFPDGPTETDVSVTVNDGDGSGSDSITVNVANVAPTANDDEMNTTELVSVTSNLLDNDSDPGNDLDAASLKILGASGPNDGVATIGALLDGNVSYLPDRGFIGADSFRYEVCDEDGDCSSANVEVNVGPVDCNAQGVIRGTQRADVLRGTAGNDVICAFAGNDTIYASGGDDLVIGDSGDDRMWGQEGGDVMRGGANTDAMDGGLGDDYLSGDSGRDVMLGRGGIDFLEMRDSSAGDAGNGGAGTDTCAKDAGDRTVSCERRE